MTESKIVWVVDQEPPFTAFEPRPFKKARPGESLQVEINLVAEVETNFRKHAFVRPNLPDMPTFAIRSDEGVIPSRHNYQGEASAPPPLSYFAAGVAFCLMSHLKSFIHERKLSVRSYNVEQRLVFTRGLPEDLDLSGKTGASCDLFETHVIIDSDESVERVKSLIEDAQAVCMAAVALINPVPSVTHVRLNGEAI
jgi:organic hydroperoxide reductase OsmC/OhrA